ncbi:transcription factor iiib-like protein [Thermochaetoides thermophila DSM 1495]|uniref:Transcription factor iiib-like protein n=1 Tax=Chaetomium thermophilum (strain DSM 1495 / CBS 144.50 / IMI 039719) TaxID=759272 RepID=G0S714_CHATD|nr:transcription factor iiib-like protein [Thermochaetoides thermophila DSM 1495]EGS21712.1 transcription factor iiib-like protein [Thermochaetoides thermophila DSM 1495]
MSSPVKIRVGGGAGSKPKSKKPNAVRRIILHEERNRESSVASTASSSTPAAPAASNRPQCKNPNCTKSDVRDGACQNCGYVVYESNIVAEVTFGETANGASVVHGTHVAADQGAIRPSGGGLAFRRVAGAGASEARERSLREAKQLMTQFAYQLQIPPHVTEKAFQLYKVAANSNFIQGRRKNTVAAICLYATCRKEENNKVMLIDFADIIKTDVFLLGRSYKELLALLPDVKEGSKPVIIEDLIFRFASKLEFLHDTNKVAMSAIRIAQRMRHDNITHGRRPAGICGAALIMAARAHNYRRTVREVVYIAKVTMATLQERMEEFANVPSAQMTVQEFHESDKLPETSHDPPFVYKQSKEWQEKHPKRTRKRKAASTASSNGAIDENAAKRQKTGQDQVSSTGTESSTQATSPPQASLNHGSSEAGVNPLSEEELALVGAAIENPEDQLEDLAKAYGSGAEESDEESEEEELDPSSEMAMAAAQGIHVPGVNIKIKPRNTPGDGSQGATNETRAGGKRTRKQKPTLRIDEEWELDENNLEKEMQGHLNDPALIGASEQVARDIEQRREREKAARQGLESAKNAANKTNSSTTVTATTNQPQQNPEQPWDPRFTPPSKVSDDPIIHEDEFADDPEVIYCKLDEKDVMIKEMIWANHNKDYMRKMQQKIFEAKMAQNGPPKPKRNRAKKPRIGEGQTAPAGSALEAAQNMLRTRAISSKLDYSRMGNLFDPKGSLGSKSGATSTNGDHSARGSSATSDAGDHREGSHKNGNRASSVTSQTTSTTKAASASEAAVKALASLANESQEEDGDEDDYDNNDDGYGGEEDYEEDGYMEDFDPFGGDDE